MNESERPFVQIPLPPPQWEEYVRKMKEQEEQANIQSQRLTVC